jgi:hypothetical protein
MRENIVRFVRVHGYTYKSFALSALICPPAAVYIAYKMPNIGVAQRIILGVLGLLSAPLLSAVVVYTVGQLVHVFRLLL